MKRRLRWLLVLAILAAFAVWLEPTRVVWGWLRGEAFYEGRPTSYWRAEIARWRERLHICSSRSMCILYMREEHWLEAQWNSLTRRRDPTWPRILDGDAASAVVLGELTDDPETNVRELAAEGLHRIRTGQTGPLRTVHYDWSEMKAALEPIRK